MNTSTDTIVAPATASGGAIAVIRLSGPEAIACCDRIFRGRKPLAEVFNDITIRSKMKANPDYRTIDK